MTLEQRYSQALLYLQLLERFSRSLQRSQSYPMST